MALPPGRLQLGGTHVFAAAGPFTIYSVPAGFTLYLDYFDLSSLAALGAGATVQLRVDTVAIATIGPIQPYAIAALAHPIEAGSTVDVNNVTAAALTAIYSIAGDIR